METRFSKSLLNRLTSDYKEILSKLETMGYRFDELPKFKKAIKNSGDAYTISYPIQGILKYHGFYNFIERLSYFPSVSFNNNGLCTITYLKFDPELKNDIIFINGNRIIGGGLQRIIYSLDFIRKYAEIETPALLISKNLITASNEPLLGKGLGTSSSGASALALAATSIVYNNDEKYMSNHRLISMFSRYHSGSGTRSAAGGISLWLCHPYIKPFDSFALRLDTVRDQEFLNEISLLSISIPSKISTFEAHLKAPKSLFYPIWLRSRKNLLLDFIDALEQHNFERIGELAEYDTLMLHSIAMNVPNNDRIIAWHPDTLKIMLKVEELQKTGEKIYFSVDTGPSVVLMIKKRDELRLKNEISQVIPYLNIIDGKIGGSPEILDKNSKKYQILTEDVDLLMR